jgi:hypothetical protein
MFCETKNKCDEIMENYDISLYYCLAKCKAWSIRETNAGKQMIFASSEKQACRFSKQCSLHCTSQHVIEIAVLKRTGNSNLVSIKNIQCKK